MPALTAPPPPGSFTLLIMEVGPFEQFAQEPASRRPERGKKRPGEAAHSGPLDDPLRASETRDRARAGCGRPGGPLRDHQGGETAEGRCCPDEVGGREELAEKEESEAEMLSVYLPEGFPRRRCGRSCRRSWGRAYGRWGP